MEFFSSPAIPPGRVNSSDLAAKFMPRAVQHDGLPAALDAQHAQRMVRFASVEPQRVSGAAFRRQIKKRCINKVTSDGDK